MGAVEVGRELGTYNYRLVERILLKLARDYKNIYCMQKGRNFLFYHNNDSLESTDENN